MNKTLNQMITEKGESTVFGNIVDNATQALLKDYFYYRYVCDDEKFILFFQRNLKQYLKQYNHYLRVENTDFDPMITRYLERQVLNKTTNNGSETITGSETGNKYITNGGSITRKTDNTATGNGRTNNNTTGSYSDYSDVENTEHTAGEENTEQRNRDILSVFPQANVSAATSGHLDDPVSYAYATQMTDHLAKGSKEDNRNTNGEVETHASGSTTGNSNTTQNTTNVLDGREVTTQATNQNTQNNLTNRKNAQNQNEENSNLRERFTGRENYDAGTLLEHAKNYISNTNAFMFLVGKVEKCFIGNLRYGEE